jgi:adenylylsulfate kinase
MHFEATTRSIAKTVSYRLSATIVTAIVVRVITGSTSLALFAGGLDAVGKMVFYFLHERLWDRIGAGKRERRPAVVWFTGLSGAGKTTIATRVTAELQRRGLKVEHLDGDSVRHIFPSTGFTRKDRDEHIKRIGYLASRLESHGVVVVASFVSPFEAARTFARGLCKNFIEVHVATPLEECERRDPKGLYRRARSGEIKDFTGIDSPYEAPPDPEIRIDTRTTDPEAAAALVVARVVSGAAGASAERGVLRPLSVRPPAPAAEQAPALDSRTVR